MRSIGYLVYLLLHLLFDKITETLRWEQGKVTRDRSIEKGIFILIQNRGPVST